MISLKNAGLTELNSKMQVEKITVKDKVYIYREGNKRTVVFDGAYYDGVLPIDLQDTPIQNYPFPIMFGGSNNNNNFYAVVRTVGNIAVFAGASGTGIRQGDNMVGTCTYYISP